MGVSRSDECAERVMAIVQPRYLVKLAVAGAVYKYINPQQDVNFAFPSVISMHAFSVSHFGAIRLSFSLCHKIPFQLIMTALTLFEFTRQVALHSTGTVHQFIFSTDHEQSHLSSLVDLYILVLVHVYLEHYMVHIVSKIWKFTCMPWCTIPLYQVPHTQTMD